MSKIGYARVSTEEQNLDRQIDALNTEGCNKIFQEKISGKDAESRIELQKLLEYIREDDTVIVLSMSRLARSTRDLYNLVHDIEEKGANIQFLKEKIDTTTPQGRLIFGIFSSIAQFEREIIKERQKDGISIAKAKGKHLGRPFLPVPENFDSVISDWKADKITATEAFKSLGISKTRFYALVKERS